MSRKARFYQKTNYFHIMVQGINKSYIFENSKDKEYYIKLIKEKKANFNLKIITYCVMDNHVHLVIYTKTIQDLSEFMRKINTMYALYYNKKYGRVGYVFRDRFKSQAIQTEKQLFNCINYVYRNPIKAGLCKFPEEYPYLDYNKNYYEECDNNEDYFIDVDDKNAFELDKNVVNNYILVHNLNIYENIEDLRKLVRYLYERNISFRRIEKVINVCRNKLSKLI